MSVWTTAYALAFGWVILSISRQYRKTKKYRPSFPLPPGPPGLPWIGNVLGINISAPWLTYADWAKTYGDFIHSRLMGKDIIILNSEETARDFFEHDSRNYSDRPYLITNDLCGIGFNSILLPYGDRWRLHRRFFHQTFRVDAITRFQAVQDEKSYQLLRQLLKAPEQLANHVFEYTASVILKSVYNYDPQPENDELINIVAKVLEIVVPAVTPQVAVVVGAIPALLSLPSWFPGMSFKKKMEIATKLSEQYVEKPFTHSLQRRLNGSFVPSMVCDALQAAEEKEMVLDESWMKDLKEAAATAFLAASETSNAVLMTFFLMMMMNPEIQKKAQAQIDAVVGKDRLPTIKDRFSLPYVDAILLEILRYSPPIPLSVPHASIDDSIYCGFHIPKGAIIVANLWSMTHDESRYPNPNIFLPERFLNMDGSLKPNDSDNVVFGFGRRICVGRHFADTSVWSVIAKVLASFTILKPLDENGIEIPVEPKFSSGPSVHPLPFKCRIIPRAEDKAKLEELIASTN